MSKFRSSQAAAASVMFGALLALPCFAQSSTADKEPEELEEIVVTGSRLATGFDMPTPVKMIDAAELLQAAPNDMSLALAQLPSLAGSAPAATAGTGSGGPQNNGQNILNLRQLGQQRTLVLVDGMRMGVTNVVNSVDIGIIPQNLVKRVDIVTGGASASYGSDAVAGAINFILDTGFEGLKAEISGGETTYHDNQNGKISVAYGVHLNDRARLVASGEFYKSEGFGYGEKTGRDWFDHPMGAFANPTTGAQPSVVLVPDARSDYGTYGGTITVVQNGTASCTVAACTGLINQQFLPGGVLAPRVFGAYHRPTTTGSSFAGGGDGAIVTQPFAPDAKRTSLFLHGEYDLNDSLTLWAQASHNRNYTWLYSQVVNQVTTSQFRIFEDNAYLPGSVTQALGGVAGLQSFSLTRYDLDFGRQVVRGDTTVDRFATGLKGRINDRWSWDTVLAYQDTVQDLDIYGVKVRNLYAASDAVTNPNTGQIVCRSQYYNAAGTFVPGGTGMDPGCVPLNLFGNGSVSQAAANYVMGWNTAEVKLQQTTFDANLRGDFGDHISLGAGPISFATGMNYRHTSADRQVDALSATYLSGAGLRTNVFPSGLEGRYGGYNSYNPSPLSGRISVTEGYLEFGVPLLKDLPAVQSLAADVAGRLSDYSQSGVEDMWKWGLNWTVNNDMRFRGTVSADTRAPSVLELFNTAQVNLGSNVFPYLSAVSQVRTSGQNITTGNPSLAPEHARTYTAGIVLTPRFISGFQASVDWYKIKITDQITTLASQTLVDNCNSGDQSACRSILVNGQPITSTTGVGGADYVVVTSKPINASSGASNSGLDFAAAYAAPMGAGKLTMRLAANYLLNVTDPVGCPAGSLGSTHDLVGAIGNGCGADDPKITGRIGVNYDLGAFGFGVIERYIDKGKMNPNYVSGVDITFNEIPAIWYTDLNFSYDIGPRLGGDWSGYLSVANVFNRDPPVTSSISRAWVSPTTEQNLYDVLGRRYTLGVRFKM